MQSQLARTCNINTRCFEWILILGQELQVIELKRFNNQYNDSQYSFWSCIFLWRSYLLVCNQCLSPLALWVRTPLRWGVFFTTLCDKVCEWLSAGRWFSPGTPASSTNKIVESGAKHHRPKPNQSIARNICINGEFFEYHLYFTFYQTVVLSCFTLYLINVIYILVLVKIISYIIIIS